jgi:hypothetical protein
MRAMVTHHGSLYNALKTLYPQHSWDPLRFSKVPHGHWTESAQRESLERLGRDKFGVKELDDWYNVSARQVTVELSFISHTYNGSLSLALKTLYPQHNWDPLRFSRAPNRYWMDENVQRDALERFGRERLGVKELDDWYSVATHAVSELSFIHNYYKGSLFNALKKLYPQHSWNRFRFSTTCRGHWTDVNAQRDALEKLGREKLGVKELDDWYSVPSHEVCNELNFIRPYYKGAF